MGQPYSNINSLQLLNGLLLIFFEQNFCFKDSLTSKSVKIFQNLSKATFVKTPFLIFSKLFVFLMILLLYENISLLKASSLNF